MSDMTTKPGRAPETPDTGQIDISEKGRNADGQPISLDRRLFMQFTAFSNCPLGGLIERLNKEQPQMVVYQDVNDARGVGILAFCEDPNYLVNEFASLINAPLLASMIQKHEFTMLGRTYTIGYENDLQDVLIDRPAQRVCDLATPWAVWYPVRRNGQFEKQPREEQRKMLMEHGGIGHAYGKAGFATDIRLAGHGLNKEDHDFIVGLLGKELFPLSALVQHMRRTRQTSEFIDSMGPFFVGKAIWQPQSGNVKR